MTPVDQNQQDALEHERLQSAAEGAGPPAVEAGVDAYRYVYHAVRAVPMPEPPPTFAMTMERLVADQPEDAVLERWLLRLVAGAGGISAAAIAAWVLPSMATQLAAHASILADLPWPLLVASALGLSLAWGLDRVMGRRQQDG